MRFAYLVSLLLVSLSTLAPAAAADSALAAEASADPAVAQADEANLLQLLGQLDRFVRGRLQMARSLAETGRLAEQTPRLRRDAERLLAALRYVRSEAELLEEDRRDALARKVRALRLQVGNLTHALDAGGATPRALASLDRRPGEGPQGIVEAGAHGDCATALAAGAGSIGGRLGGSVSATGEVWLRYTAPRAGVVSVTTVGSDFDTELTVYAGCPGAKGAELAANDDASGLQSAVSFAVAAGEERLIRLRGVGGAQGLFFLQLGFGGGIAGTVTNAQGGSPLADVEVDVWDSSGFFITYTYTNATGSYNVSGLNTGSYFAATSNFLGYVDELYNDIPCPGGVFGGGCNPVNGTSIPVQNGHVTSGINFGLRAGGAISGRVREAATGLAIPGASVVLYRSSGQWFAEDVTDVAGRYRFSGLGAGGYFAIASTFEHQGELYREIPCPAPGCNPTTGTPIAVSLGATTTGVDFTLDRLGSIAGTITGAVGGEPIVNAFAEVDDSSGDFVGFAPTGADGHYQLGGLPAGTYYARTLNYQFYVDELYDDLPCPSDCDPTTGTPIPVSLDATTSGVDFALDLGGNIAGRLTDASNGEPIGFFSFVNIWDAGGEIASFGYSNEVGDYVAPGLATGSYFATTAANFYFNELYDDLPCGPPAGCDPPTGTPIPVTETMTTPGIDFALTPLGKISGTLTDAVGGSPLSAASVQAWDGNGFPVSGAQTDASGAYTLIGFQNGSYFVTTAADGHFNELYDNLPCGDSCNPTVGTPVPTTVGAVTTGVDFALNRLGVIAGSVVDAVSGHPLEGVYVTVFGANGFFADSGFTDAAGHYAVSHLAAGTYFATTNEFNRYLDELFDDLPCQFGSCTPTTGTPITVALDATTAGIDFALVPLSAIAGKVTASNGSPLPGVAIDIWTLGGSYLLSTATDTAGRYLVFLDPGTYFVSTDNGLGALDEIYDNVPCPLGSPYEGLCDPTTGTPLTVFFGMPAITGVDFVLSGIPIFRDGFESGNTSHWSATVP